MDVGSTLKEPSAGAGGVSPLLRRVIQLPQLRVGQLLGQHRDEQHGVGGRPEDALGRVVVVVVGVRGGLERGSRRRGRRRLQPSRAG